VSVTIYIGFMHYYVQKEWQGIMANCRVLCPYYGDYENLLVVLWERSSNLYCMLYGMYKMLLSSWFVHVWVLVWSLNVCTFTCGQDRPEGPSNNIWCIIGKIWNINKNKREWLWCFCRNRSLNTQCPENYVENMYKPINIRIQHSISSMRPILGLYASFEINIQPSMLVTPQPRNPTHPSRKWPGPKKTMAKVNQRPHGDS
jgi:hypothetical protein